MKRCKNITCWTDYPFTSLGDISGKKAPIRRVCVINFDNNKYAEIEILGYGVRASVKAGYLYSQPGRCGDVKNISFRKLERMIRPPKDGCQVCKGTCGGVKGNENIINGMVICDYCDAALKERNQE